MKPCPYRILLGVVGVPEKKEIPLTVPRTPAFVQKKRTPKPTQEDEDELLNDCPMTVPVKPKLPVRRTVEICPFSFDSKKSLTEREENKTGSFVVLLEKRKICH